MDHSAFLALLVSSLLLASVPVATAHPEELRALDREVSEYEIKGAEALESGQYRKALRAFSKAQALSDGGSGQAALGLAVAHLRLDQLHKALLYGHQAVTLAETSDEQAIAENLLGTILHTSYQLERPGFRRDDETLAEAESRFRMALDLSNGQLTAAWSNLSLVLEQRGLLMDAQTALEELLSRVSEDRSAQARLCWVKYLISSTTPETGHDSDETPVIEPPLAERTDESIFKIEGDVKSPERTESSQPIYTEAARLKGIQGVVVLEAIIDTKGNVTNVRVLEGLPLGITESAVRSACRWRFKPATLHGEPVPVYFNLTTRFTLGKKK